MSLLVVMSFHGLQEPETQPPNLGNIPKVAAARAHDHMPAPEAPARAPNSEDVNFEGFEDSNPQPKRSKKKKASKSAASNQLINFLEEMEKQQQDSMSQFLEGIKKIEDESSKHTENTLLKIAKVFVKGRKRDREDVSSEDESD